MLSEKQEVLEQITEIDGPLNVVAVVGLYRTGKSYLLNRLAGEHEGFQIGSTIEAMTKGIWVWCRPHPTKKNQFLLLMDTEGLGDVQKVPFCYTIYSMEAVSYQREETHSEEGNKTHDCWIFVLASLLCSTLVFNVKNVFDQDTLDKISFVTEMSNHILVSNQKESLDAKDFDLYFPIFILVIRDFSLDIVAEGKSVTPDEYLDDVCLKVSSQKDRTYNDPRQTLRKYFVKRKCFTFSCPAKTKQLKMLNTLKDDELDEDFCGESDRFNRFILEECPPRKLDNGRMVNGRMFVSLVQSHVASIQSGKLPCIEDALNTMAYIENTKALDACVETYTTKMNASVTFPTDSLLLLSEAHHDCLKEAIAQFLKTAVYDKDKTFQTRANELINKKYNEFMEENEKISINKSLEALTELSASVDEKRKAGEFAKPGGFELYQSYLNEVLAKYEQLPGLGVKKGEIVYEFIKKKQDEGKQILDADRKMTQVEREAEENRQRTILRERARTLETRRVEDKLILDEDEKRQRTENIDLYLQHNQISLAVLANRIKEFEDASKIKALEMELNLLKTQNQRCRIM